MKVELKRILQASLVAAAVIIGAQSFIRKPQVESTMNTNKNEVQNLAIENEVRITDVNFLMEDGTGFLRVFGIVHNNTNNWVTVECHITSYDSNGKPIDVDGWKAEYEKEVHPKGEDAEAYVESVFTQSIPPKGKVCINHLRDGKKLKDTPSKVNIKVADVSVSSEGVLFNTPNFTFSPRKESQKHDDGSTKTYDNGFIIKGSVTNIGNTISKRSRLGVIWYNKSGKIVEIQEPDLYSGIPSNKSIKDPASYLLTSNKIGDIMPGEQREFSGSVNWPKSLVKSRDFGKFELMAYDETWVD